MRIKMYLHGSKESNLDQGEAIGLKGKALDYFRYALYEVELEVEVDPDTGEATIAKVDGRFVAPKPVRAKP